MEGLKFNCTEAITTVIEAEKKVVPAAKLIKKEESDVNRTSADSSQN